MSLNDSTLRIEKVKDNHLIQPNYIRRETEAPRIKSSGNARNEKYDTGIQETSEKTGNVRRKGQ